MTQQQPNDLIELASLKRALAEYIRQRLPECHDKRMALCALNESQRWAIGAIARKRGSNV